MKFYWWTFKCEVASWHIVNGSNHPLLVMLCYVNIVFPVPLKWDQVPELIWEMYCFKLLEKER